MPIDNRPVCYQLPTLIAAMNSGIEIYLPDRKLLGSLTEYADVDGLFKWLMGIKQADAVVLSLDTIAYGGLISSRRCTCSFEQIKSRLENLKKILLALDAKIYAFSSIMRISNNNINEEEKEYWDLYGKKIFKYSYELHKSGYSQADVPEDILNDYLATRKRNFEINKIYLEWQKQGIFDTLIFSKDDCAEFGLNVKEAAELEALGGFTKTGADEIPLTLLARAVNSDINVCPVFLEEDSKNLVSNYEDISILQSVTEQLQMAGCRISDENTADILLYVNNFKDHQGEIVMNRMSEPYGGNWQKPSKNYALADVRFANGADNSFVEKVFQTGFGDEFCGYAGWNTSANTLGSLICAVKILFSAKNKGVFQPAAFKRLQAVRFLDDWAYQANIRQQLSCPDVMLLTKEMKFYEEKIKKGLNIDFKAEYSFPWNRLFEVEIGIN